MEVKKIRRDTSVSLSQDRAEQLRVLAEAHGLSPRELVESWISTGLRVLGVSPKGVPYWAPPEISIRKILLNGLSFLELRHNALPTTLLRVTRLDDEDPVETSEALALAQALDETARVNRPWEYNCTKHGGRIVAVRRRGTGVILLVAESGDDNDEEREAAARVVLSPAMALELSDAMRFLCEPTQEPAVTFELADPPKSAAEKELAEAYEVAW